MTDISSKNQNMKEGSGNMKIIVNKNDHYVSMTNYHLIDNRLSLKAKGLLSVMLNFPNNWEFSVKGLIALCKEGRDSVRATLDELKKYGYLTIKRIDPNTENNRISWQCIVCGNPEEQEIKQENSQYTGFQYIENQDVENPYINKESKNKKVLYGIVNEDRTPSFEEVQAICKSLDSEEYAKEVFNDLTKQNFKDNEGKPIANLKAYIQGIIQNKAVNEIKQKKKEQKKVLIQKNKNKDKNKMPDFTINGTVPLFSDRYFDDDEDDDEFIIRGQEPKKTIQDQPIPYNEPEPDLSIDSFERMFK